MNMYKPSAAEIAEAQALSNELLAESDFEFQRHGHNRRCDALYLASHDLSAWLSVARKYGEVRNDLRSAIDRAVFRIRDDYKVALPACLVAEVA